MHFSINARVYTDCHALGKYGLPRRDKSLLAMTILRNDRFRAMTGGLRAYILKLCRAEAVEIDKVQAEIIAYLSYISQAEISF